MEVLYTHCAGLDVHKKTVVATVLSLDAQGRKVQETRTFPTMTADLLGLSDWLQSHAVTHVAMESTGEYWRPVFNILESSFEVLLVNAQHIHQVPGRKTDVKDSAWLAELLQHGLLRASFIPPAPQRDLRDLTRHRSNFVRERTNLINRVHKTLEGANIKLASVATNIMGVSGRAMLEALLAGQTDPTLMAELAKGRLRTKRDDLSKALDGRVKPHHRFILTELLCQIDSLDETIVHFDEEIDKHCEPLEEHVAHRDTIPGVGRDTAEALLAEIGTDMTRFGSARRLSAWAGVAPGNNESGGRRRSSKTRQGNRAVKRILIQAAWAASRTKGTYLSALYHRLAGRRGKKKAIVAVAHALLVIVYHMIVRNEPYKELGGDYFDRQDPETTAKRLVKRLEKLGYQVTVQAQPAGAAA
ncbi:MAG: IS110 family transposase [Chloroflexi bacterium]|nr:IS110 family transposase [Chloroflexota bacterium]